MKRRIVKKALKRFIQNNQKYNKLIIKMDNVIYKAASTKENIEFGSVIQNKANTDE